MKGRAWTQDELQTTLKLYCLTPFGRIHSGNLEIVALAGALDRTPGSIALKMTNFASLDPTIARKGMGNHSRLDKIVWDDFFANMDSYLSDEVRGPETVREPVPGFRHDLRPGLDVERVLKTRINQDFFRNMILASYDKRCALTGIEAPELLVASHIVPWSVNPAARTNPANGICLNALHDRAFDCGFITINEDLSVRFSTMMPKVAKEKLLSFGENKMRLPDRFVPAKEHLDFHRTHIFVAN